SGARRRRLPGVPWHRRGAPLPHRAVHRGASAGVRPADVEEALTRAHHDEWARVVAGLGRRFGDLDLAEDAAAEAFAVAVDRWPREGVPPNPGGWLTTTATRRAIDHLRRESRRTAKYEAAHMLSE